MNDDIKHAPAKVVSAVGVFFGSMTWGEIAQMMAALYTGCLILEWAWKRVLKPLAQRWGLIQGKRADFLDSTGAAPLGEK